MSLPRKPVPFPKIRSSKRIQTPRKDPLTDLTNTFIADEPPPDPPDLWDPEPRREYRTYSRADWGARDPREDVGTVELPAKKVIYTAEYQGYVPACRNKEECIKALHLLQTMYMDEKGLPDIPYNFILGGDGNIYEGRGWNTKPHKSVKFDEYKDNTIDIGMIVHSVHEPLKKRAEIENDLFDILIQFIQDHTDDKFISTECNIEGFTGKRKY